MDVKQYIQDSIDTKSKILNDSKILSTLTEVSDIIVKAYKQGKKVLTAGNGGSSSDAQHIAGELVSRFFFERPGLEAYCLTSNSSVLTAICNDYGYEYAFSKQIEAKAEKGDVFIAISTSGNSKNIILALDEAKKKGIVTVGLTGAKDCEMDSLCDYIVHIPSESTPTVQEAQMMVGHIICALVEDKLFNKYHH